MLLVAAYTLQTWKKQIDLTSYNRSDMWLYVYFLITTFNQILLSYILIKYITNFTCNSVWVSKFFLHNFLFDFEDIFSTKFLTWFFHKL